MELRVASPCSADWDRMQGNERVRYCPQCKLNVYNFAAMVPPRSSGWCGIARVACALASTPGQTERF